MLQGDAAQLSSKKLAQTAIPTHYFDCKKGDLFTPYCLTNPFIDAHRAEAQLLQKSQIKEEEDALVTRTTFDTSSHANHILKYRDEYAKATKAAIARFLKKFHENGK